MRVLTVLLVFVAFAAITKASPTLKALAGLEEGGLKSSGWGHRHKAKRINYPGSKEENPKTASKSCGKESENNGNEESKPSDNVPADGDQNNNDSPTGNTFSKAFGAITKAKPTLKSLGHLHESKEINDLGSKEENAKKANSSSGNESENNGNEESKPSDNVPADGNQNISDSPTGKTDQKTYNEQDAGNSDNVDQGHKSDQDAIGDNIDQTSVSNQDANGAKKANQDNKVKQSAKGSGYINQLIVSNENIVGAKDALQSSDLSQTAELVGPGTVNQTIIDHQNISDKDGYTKQDTFNNQELTVSPSGYKKSKKATASTESADYYSWTKK